MHLEAPKFKSFVQAGFECSTHRNKFNVRLDLRTSTGHDRFAARDYARLRDLGIFTVREGARWPFIESASGHFDFAALSSLLETATEAGMQVILDLMHFGWPDHVDVMDASFASSFARYTREVIHVLRRFPDTCRFIAPVNEISFLAWAGGDAAGINPHLTGRADELKRNLARAYIAAAEVLRAELPSCRLVSPEPIIHVASDSANRDDWEAAAGFTLAQYQAWDMISGRMHPELGGSDELLDILGLNFYAHNQWVHGQQKPPLTRHDVRYKPLREMIRDVWRRYRRPLFIAETGAEDELRADWFGYVCDEVRASQESGIPVAGVCLYPVLNHPGWDDDRHCHNGLFDYADAAGNRERYEPLADVIAAQQRRVQITKGKQLQSINPDVVCFSHLRWNFVFQRPQHLMSRLARKRRVFFLEEPVYEDCEAMLRQEVCSDSGVHVITPVLPIGMQAEESQSKQSELFADLFRDKKITNLVAWFYTPMALKFANRLPQPMLTVYDCMDELSAFRGAPPEMQVNEQRLFEQADLVFTGGASLYARKQGQHHSVHLFPSSIDVAHFEKAKLDIEEPEDQRKIPYPRLGYAGVLDERIDFDLIRDVAAARPNWHLVLLGPTAKIDPAAMPQAHNIHYLGLKRYDQLPSYFAGWDLGMLPFALNEATRYISPTKTPEYLAAGLPVVSTPIRDVISPYGDLGLVAIAQNSDEYIASAESLLKSADQHAHSRTQSKTVEEFLAKSSWDRTAVEMESLIDRALQQQISAVSGNRAASEQIAHV